ncbi:Sodium/glucose cotransporter [Roseimaritima multifibrata]|uniref:Sodium/glucose cotransporter n=1 Tax=Roseimaritima multifibrata TaxID=1930274 RepID=A0A517MI72_9BACT|nr:sodium:solute symporter family protein [Roseimaritima multifibrata]QDS94574.1 Sodium/glucose cotransporter [Roseimaritima multifibrata]
MILTAVDYLVIAAYFAITLGIGLWFRNRASKDITEYFISGRSLPWWIAGTSMVATTFAADTPLAVTGLTIQHGLAGNWVWWSFALGGMITVFVYAKLWRRSGVMTDVELVELRYSGKPAALLRGSRAIYIALIVNPIIIGWVTSAMFMVLDETIFYEVPASALEQTVFGAHALSVRPWLIIFGTLAMVGLYGTMSGMWGVAVADAFQFCLGMFGCIALAWLAISHFGGASQLEAKVIENFGEGGSAAFDLIPDFSGDNAWLPLHVFLLLMLVQWWATWYPGAEPGGGGFVVQRMAACKDERHSLLATLWFQIAHYCVRPWPWLIVALAALAMYPDLRQGELADPAFNSGVGFPRVMRDLSPPGLRGLLTVTFFAAFMSTLSTQMNWGASYLVRDVYQRFISPDASDRQLNRASRYASVIVLVAGGIASVLMFGQSVDAAWRLLLALGAGTGAVFMLRWFWWRINAWTEIVSMFGSLVFFFTVEPLAVVTGMVTPDGDGPVLGPEVKMFAVAVMTIVLWLIVTWLTPPVDAETLDRFYQKVRPDGPFWKPVADRNPTVIVDRDLGLSIFAAICATGIVYAVLPGVGNLIFGHYQTAIVCGLVAIVLSVVVAILVKRLTRGQEENT